MESVPLEMDDIFGDRMGDEDEEQRPELLPDLETEIQPTQNDEEAGNFYLLM